MESKAAVIFGFKSVGHIADDGGTQSWRLDQKHVGTFDYVIITRNRHRFPAEGPEPHGSAFMIGKVSGVVPSTEPHCIADAAAGKPQRYLIQISEAALLHIPRFWKFGRWPVHIAPLSELGVNPDDYEFKPLSDFLESSEVTEEDGETVDPGDAPPPKSVPEYIADAKHLLSAQIGIPVSAIEIAIRF